MGTEKTYKTSKSKERNTHMPLNWYHWHHMKYMQKHYFLHDNPLHRVSKQIKNSKAHSKSQHQPFASISVCMCDVRVVASVGEFEMYIYSTFICSIICECGFASTHTHNTHSSSECVVLTVEWASLENKLWFSSSANMRALSPDFLLCVKRIAAAKVYLHMIRTILVLIDSLLRAQRFSIVCSKQVRAACASTSLFSTVFIFHCWFWVLVQLH